jgi:hypothetical protein
MGGSGKIDLGRAAVRPEPVAQQSGTAILIASCKLGLVEQLISSLKAVPEALNYQDADGTWPSKVASRGVRHSSDIIYAVRQLWMVGTIC